MGGQRPELKGPPELFYNEKEAKKYSQSSRYAQIQRELAFRAYELLDLPQFADETLEKGDDDEASSLFNPRPRISSLLLDIGVGSGICASILGENNHIWVGLDISAPMLHVAKSRLLHAGEDSTDHEKEECFNDDVDGDKFDREFGEKCDDDNNSLDNDDGGIEDSDDSPFEDNDEDSDDADDPFNPSNSQRQNGDLILGDMGHGLGFRPGSFDGAISISALQWLCNADTTGADPRARLRRLFSSLYSVLRIGARAIFQFYPENASQIEIILNIALKVGFNGGMVVDFPKTPRRKKYFLILMVGHAPLPVGKDDATFRQTRHKRKKNIKDRAWVLRKKELRRKRGFGDVPQDTKYTARKRGPRF